MLMVGMNCECVEICVPGGNRCILRENCRKNTAWYFYRFSSLTDEFKGQ